MVTRNSDLEFMQHPMRWPNMVLPVKRNTQVNNECGILLGEKPIVYLVNMYQIPANLVTAPQIAYQSYEAIVTDGWKVD